MGFPLHKPYPYSLRRFLYRFLINFGMNFHPGQMKIIGGESVTLIQLDDSKHFAWETVGTHQPSIYPLVN